MKHYFTLIVSFFSITIQSLSQTPTIQLVEYATGFTQPSDIESANDARLFVSELTGKIKIIQNGAIISTPFLDLSAKGASIYSFCFHPNYTQNGILFVYYRQQDGYGRISKFTRSVSNPNQINLNSEVEILVIPYILPGGHTGGEIAFGPDSFLYITTGDDGLGPRNKYGDPDNNAQNLKKMFGKILRIDVNSGNNYSIPPTNPYLASNDGIPDEIWARGLRNPWRMSFDSSTGDMWIGDNGADGWEEVNFLPRNTAGGSNFGWRCYEGSHLYVPTNCPDSTQLIFPIQEYTGYAHDTTSGGSVMGGQVYRGNQFPALSGYYVYADWVTGKFWTLRRNEDGSRTNIFQGTLTSQPVTFGLDSNREMYVASFDQGIIYKIIASMNNQNIGVKATTKKATCDKKGLTVRQDAQIILTGFELGDRYDFNRGINYTGVASFTLSSKPVPASGIIAQNLTSPVSEQTFTIRIFKTSNIHKDINVTLAPTICTPCLITPPQVANHVICGAGKDTLVASGCAPSSAATWFLDSLATSKALGISTGATYITPVLAKTTSFFVACVRDSICSSDLMKVTVTVLLKSLIPLKIDTTVCAYQKIAILIGGCSSQHPLRVFQDSLLQKEVRVIGNILTIDSVLTVSYFYSICNHDSTIFCKISPSFIRIHPRALPQVLQANKVTEKSFHAEWKGIKGVTYQLRFRRLGTTNWNYAQLIAATSTGVYSYEIENLLKGTTYEWSVKEANCDDDRTYSETKLTRTLSCPPKLILNSEILPATLYQANDIIESTSTLSEGIAQFYAGQVIILKPGFKTSINQIFTAQVKGCD